MATQYTQNASLEVSSFLRDDVYAELMLALGAQSWTRKGPPNMQNYRACWDTGDCVRAAGDDSVELQHRMSSSPADTGVGQHQHRGGLRPDIVRRVFNFLTGFNFMSYLRMITAQELGGGVEGEVRCFSRGDYTMVCDPAFKQAQLDAKMREKGVALTASSSSSSAAAAAAAAPLSFVDATLCCTSSTGGWTEADGGYVSYLTADDELLSVPPKRNSLSLVQREHQVSHLTASSGDLLSVEGYHWYGCLCVTILTLNHCHESDLCMLPTNDL